jgi:hypothetical protein
MHGQHGFSDCGDDLLRQLCLKGKSYRHFKFSYVRISAVR